MIEPAHESSTIHHDQESGAESLRGTVRADRPVASPKPWLAPLVLVVVCLGLYLPGLDWGLPGYVSWAQDSIAGVRTLGPVRDWPDAWAGRYPPLHYFILRAVYEPILRSWQSGGASWIDETTGQEVWGDPQAPKISNLILIARVVTVLMAVGAVVALWAASRCLTGDPRAAFLAALVFSIGAEFTYYAHLDCVDAPSIFWFTLSLHAWARLLESHRAADALYLGLAAAAATCTKDAVAGMYPGMAAVLIVRGWSSWRRMDRADRGWLRAVFRPSWMVGLVVFVGVVLFLNGALTNPRGYLDRLAYWVSPPPDSWHAHQHRHEGIGGLGLSALHYAAGAVGWPIGMAMVAAMVYGVFRRGRLAWTLLLPIAGYFLVVLVPIRFVYARFLLAPLAVWSVMIGATGGALWRSKAVPAAGRVVLAGLILGPSLLYAVAVDAEMIHDSRYAAERWMAANAEPSASIGAFSLDERPLVRPHYLPRLHEMGYTTYPVVMDRAWFSRPQPEYLILDSFTYDDFSAGQRACMNELLEGQYGYVRVASFGPRFLGDRRSWWGVAGWFTPPLGKISPTLLILRRPAESD